MSETKSILRRTSDDWIAISLYASSGLSAARASDVDPSNWISTALPCSIQDILPVAHPLATKRSQASEISPLSDESAAIKVAMGISNPETKPKLALIAGPTASGKTALALRLAKKHDVVIINADSAQVYADLPILSAQPSPEEMEQAPHKLFGYLDGTTACSAARWARDAKRAIGEAHTAGAIPVLVGGTGLYVRTLLDGIAPIPEINAELRAAVRHMPVADAYAALQEKDPQAATALAPTDSSRITRALEVVESTGRSILSWHRDKVGGIADDVSLKPLLLLPPRDWLYERCDKRFDMMFTGGAVEEVAALLERRLPDDAPVMRAIGVREIAAMLAGATTRDQAIALGKIATRQYAKRQYTWFRNQAPTIWPRIDSDINGVEIDKFVI